MSLIARAKYILKHTPILEYMWDRPVVSECHIDGKLAVRFSKPQPYPIKSGGDLYIFEDATVKFVDIDEDGKVYSVTLEMIIEAYKLLIRECPQCVNFVFECLEFSEDYFEFQFTDPNYERWHPVGRVCLEKREVEYLEDIDK